jgi:hypothetical protein
VGKAHEHLVSDGHFRDTGTDRVDDAGTFVAEDSGKRSGIPLVTHDGIRVTHTASNESNPNLAGARLVNVNFCDDEWLFFFEGDSGFGLHGALLVEFLERAPLVNAIGVGR